MKKFIEIVADYNDGDYCTNLEEISDKILEIITPVIEAIKKQKGRCNWDTVGNGGEKQPHEMYEGLFSEDAMSAFEEFIPYAPENDDIHTIESIRILEVSKITKLI